MKIFTLLLLFIFLLPGINSHAQDVWSRESGNPQENTLNDITRIPGTEKLIAVGEGSTVMISSDAGETWDIILHPAGKDNDYICYGLCFVNENIGFIFGSWETILKTTDGGHTWSEKYAAGNSHYSYHFNDLTFVDETHGFAAGKDGLLKTDDGGETWEPVTIGVSFELYRIAFSDSLTGYITGYSNTQMLKTEDGGNIWSVISFPQGLPNFSIYDINFHNDSVGILVGGKYDYTYVYRTENKGVSWNEVYSGGPPSSEGKLVFLDSQTGFYSFSSPVQYSTYFFVTNDGGITWNLYKPNLSWLDSRSVCALNANTVVAVGSYGSVHKSINSGVDWTPLYQKIFDGDVYSVRFVDQDYGYAFSDGTDGGVSHTYLMKTEDGGMSWDKACDFNFFVGSSCFLNRDTGFVASDFMGLSFNITTDGGASWNLFQTGYNNYFEPTVIKFYDMNKGLIGGSWYLVRTSDGGNNWQFCSYDSFIDIEYKSADTVFAVGQTVLRSTDGGQTWETIVIEGLISANDIYFLNNQTAFLACYNQIFKSADGGCTWSPALMNNANPINILSMSFPTPEIGYASGSGTYENMLKTTDGGDTWNPIETNESSVLNNVCFFDADNGLAFGNNGLMIKTTTGGVVSVEKQSHDNSGNLLKVYPNPSSSNVTIESQQNSNWHLELSNLNGQILFQRSVTDKSTVIDISSLPPGLYFVRMSNEKTVEIGKFVKQ